MIEPGGLDAFDPRRQVVHVDIGLRHFDRDHIDIRRNNGCVRPDLRRRHRQNRRTRPDIRCRSRRQAVGQQRLERQKTALRRAMVARAEGHRRLDQQGNAAIWNAVGIVTAIDEEAPRFDRVKIAPDVSDPIRRRHF